MNIDLLADPSDVRAQAIGRLTKRRDFYRHVFVFVVVNTALTIIWLVTTPGGFYWPMFPIAGWGIGLVFHGYDTFAARALSEEQIEREMKRLTRR